MHRTITVAVAAGLAGSVAADIIDINLDPGSETTIASPVYTGTFGLTGSIGIDVALDGEGKLDNAGLCAVDLIVQSAGTYSFGGFGTLRMTNIGISLERKGGQEFFFNETQGSSQPGDFAGFLDTDGLVALTGEVGLDLSGDGVEDVVTDLSTIDEQFRTFDFEALILRDGGSSVYDLTTFFVLDLATSSGGFDIPISIEADVGGSGLLIPAPAPLAAILFAGVMGARRRR
jgi:hypothetical protein